MKPPPFDYVKVDSIDETLAKLTELGDEAKILAGGQSLVPMMNFRLATPAALIDINDIPNLDHVTEQDSGVRIGALVRHQTIESKPMKGAFAILAEAASHVGHLPIRTRGTFGGSIAHADPSAEFALLALTMEASIVARSSRGERTIPASDFFVMPLVTALEPDELLTEIQFPAPPPGTHRAFVEMARRAGDFAIISVAALLAFDDDVRCSWARIGMTGVAPTPVRVPSVESVLVGNPLDDDTIAEAAARAPDGFQPAGDIHGSSDFRLHLASVFTRRALLALRA